MNGRERLSIKSPPPLFAKEGLNFFNHWNRVCYEYQAQKLRETIEAVLLTL
jgi:hypothetical protein